MIRPVLVLGVAMTLAAPMQTQTSSIVTTDVSWENVSRYQMQCADEYTDIMSELKCCEDLKEWYDRYLNLLDRYSDICDKPESIYDYYSEEQIEYLLRMCETECHGKDFESKVHVCEVALNRIASKKFPDTPKEAITAPHQFCYYRTISEVTDETRRALECAFQIPDLTEGSLYFHSIKECDNFYGKTFVMIDKAGHKFYS